MNRSIVIMLLLVIGLPAHGQAFKAAVSPLMEASCIDCHDADTDTQLNFEKLGHDPVSYTHLTLPTIHLV